MIPHHRDGAHGSQRQTKWKKRTVCLNNNLPQTKISVTLINRRLKQWRFVKLSKATVFNYLISVTDCLAEGKIEVERKPNSSWLITKQDKARQSQRKKSIPVVEIPKGSLVIPPSSLELWDCLIAIHLVTQEVFSEYWWCSRHCS